MSSKQNPAEQSKSATNRGMRLTSLLHLGYQLASFTVSQTASLVNRLPIEIHLNIFEHLTPINQPLLGAPCIFLYNAYKKYFVEGQSAAGSLVNASPTSMTRNRVIIRPSLTIACAYGGSEIEALPLFLSIMDGHAYEGPELSKTRAAIQTSSTPSGLSTPKEKPKISECASAKSSIQISDLVKRLSPEIHERIFLELGPASRRLLGATCHTFYEIYKKHHFDKQIIIRLSEAATALHGPALHPAPNFIGTEQYQLILATWLCPATEIESDAWADRTASRRAKIARERLAALEWTCHVENRKMSKQERGRLTREGTEPAKKNTSFRMFWYQENVVSMARRHDGWYLVPYLVYVKGEKEPQVRYAPRHHGKRKKGYSMRVPSGRGVWEI
ncbi:hypothetical protein BDZ45DRAFT_749330 [Acephala macrosclerotiorum]|nr:hypothetical protein BDZ45DRAFT_749330 [Acephala macrosclerotiorum]